MGGYKIKRGPRVYHLREFGSLLELARRGVLAHDDLIFLPEPGHWVPAHAVPDVQKILQATGQIGPDGRPMTAKRKALYQLPEIPLDSIEVIPVDFPAVVAPEQVEPIVPSPPTPAEGFRPFTPPPSWTPPVPSPGAEVLPPASPPATSLPGAGPVLVPMQRLPSPPRPAPASPALGSPAPAGVTPRPVSPSPRRPPRPRPTSVEEPSPSSFSLGRVLVLMVFPTLLGALVVWDLRSTATREFAALPTPIPIAELSTPAPRAAQPDDDLARQRQFEEELRAKIPLKLQRAVGDPDEVQDDIFTELLNAGTRPSSVRLEPLGGEFPRTVSLKKLEMNVRITFRAGPTEIPTALAVASLVTGKYIVRGPLRVVELIVEANPGEDLPPATYTVAAADVRSFYSHRTSLGEFLAVMEAEQ